MRALSVQHRSAVEVDLLLLRLLHTTPEALDPAELALRAGCGAERVRSHLVRLEREGHLHHQDTPSGPRWTAH